MIGMYWWEGYFGPLAALGRLCSGRSPLVQNFGDELSAFIVSRLAGEPVEYRSGPGKLLALGSIFFALADRDVVWGSGLLNPSHRMFAQGHHGVTYRAVRGPRTRAELARVGVEAPAVYGDPALLLPELAADDVPRTHAIGVVPHFMDLEAVRAARPDALVIDVQRPFPLVVRDILSCDTVLATSLHGLIVAEVYGRRARLVFGSEPGPAGRFKYEDYFASTGRALAYRVGYGDLTGHATSAEVAALDVDRAALRAAFPYPVRAAEQVGWSALAALDWERLRPRLSVGQVMGQVRRHVILRDPVC